MMLKPTPHKPIQRRNFDLYEQMHLSGQIEPDEFVRILRDNPEFRAWYEPRAEKRMME